MAELFYPTKYRGKGPWLLASVQLLALDNAVDEYFSKCRSVGASAAADRGEATASQVITVRTITFRLRHDKELETSSFKEALVHPAIANESVLGLKYELRARNTTALLVLEKNTEGRAKKQTNWAIFDTGEDETELQIDVEPRSAPVSEELFSVLRDWAIGTQPPIWQRWILNVRSLGRMVLVVWALLFIINFFSSTPPNYKEHYKQEARKLLDQGINSNNQQKALELLLAIESEYVPPSAQLTAPERSLRSLVTNFLGLFAVSVIAFFPELCIGVGSGKQYLRWWQAWVKFVSVTVPSLLVARYVWPQLFNIIERAFGR